MTASERSGNRSGSAAFCFTRNSSSGRIGLIGEFESVLRGQSRRSASHRFGVRTTRRSDGKLSRREIAGRHAVGGDHEIGDQVLGAVGLLGFQPANAVAVENRPGLQRLEAQCAVDLPEFFHPLRRLVLKPQVLVEPGDGGHRRGHRPAALQPSGHAVVGQLGPVPHRSPVNVGVLQGAVARRPPSRRRSPAAPH